MDRQPMTEESVVRCPARSAGKWSAFLALVMLALPGGAAHAQIYAHPDPASGRTFYPVARAYRLDSVAGNATWSGEARRSVEDAVPGLLRLADMPSGGSVIIDLRAFATTRPGETFVQVLTSPAPTLVMQVLGSAKCPTVYSPQMFASQSVTNIRTHWAIMGFQPGTTFTLTLSVQCRQNAGGQLVTHQDRWTWKIVATPESLRALLIALHSHTIGTIGVPVIASEPAYDALIAAAEQIQARIRAGDNAGAKAAIDAMDQLVVSYASAGRIAATTENPGDCWIRVELEYLRSLLP
jgi:hypothetical protein